MRKTTLFWLWWVRCNNVIFACKWFGKEALEVWHCDIVTLWHWMNQIASQRKTPPHLILPLERHQNCVQTSRCSIQILLICSPCVCQLLDVSQFYMNHPCRTWLSPCKVLKLPGALLGSFSRSGYYKDTRIPHKDDVLRIYNCKIYFFVMSL